MLISYCLRNTQKTSKINVFLNELKKNVLYIFFFKSKLLVFSEINQKPYKIMKKYNKKKFQFHLKLKLKQTRNQF